MPTRRIPWPLVSLLFLAGCGGSAPEPREPATDTETEKSDPPAEEPSGEKPVEKDPVAETPAQEAPEPVRPSRSAKDVITEEGVLFTFSFRDSDAYDVADKKCTEKSGDDPKKKAACMQKVSDDLSDSMFFKQDPDGKWRWVTLRRSGAKATVLHKIVVEFGEEDSETTVRVLPKGRDEGKKPMAHVPKEVVIRVEDGSIVIDDRKHGKMVYNPKAGLVQ